jgi:hypothetical protein
VLARLIAAALETAPDLAVATARIEQARATVRAREADRRPQIGASATLTGSRVAEFELFGGNELPPGIAVQRERIVGRAGLDASYDLDLFGRLAADRRAARARLDAATADAAAVRLALVTDVARNYVAVVAAQARAGVARENIAAARDLVAITRARVKAGLVAGIDATRGDSLLAETSATLPPLEGERGSRIAALTTLTGLGPDDIGRLLAAAPADARLGMPGIGVPSDLLAVGRTSGRRSTGWRRRTPDRSRACGTLSAADHHRGGGAGGEHARRLPERRRAQSLRAAGLAGRCSTSGATVRRWRVPARGPAEAVADYRRVVLQAFGDVERGLALAGASDRQRRALEALVAPMPTPRRLRVSSIGGADRLSRRAGCAAGAVPEPGRGAAGGGAGGGCGAGAVPGDRGGCGGYGRSVSFGGLLLIPSELPHPVHVERSSSAVENVVETQALCVGSRRAHLDFARCCSNQTGEGNSEGEAQRPRSGAAPAGSRSTSTSVRRRVVSISSTRSCAWRRTTTSSRTRASLRKRTSSVVSTISTTRSRNSSSSAAALAPTARSVAWRSTLTR